MSLYDLLSNMALKRKKHVAPKRQPSKQMIAVVDVLNASIGHEMETVEIAKLARLKRDTVLNIMTRLESSYSISSRITTSPERKKGKHSKTKVKKWTCHKLIGTK